MLSNLLLKALYISSLNGRRLAAVIAIVIKLYIEKHFFVLKKVYSFHGRHRFHEKWRFAWNGLNTLAHQDGHWPTLVS
jgi:hypothetical protein